MKQSSIKQKPFRSLDFRNNLYSWLLPIILLALAILIQGTDAATNNTSDESSVFLPAVLTRNIIQTPLCGELVTVGGAIEADTTWSSSKTYIVANDIYIEPGVSLTIQPGIVIKFMSDKSLLVEGKLVANGTEENPIFFTSWKDDSKCGDTNDDGSASAPRSADWSWIEFKSNSDPTSSLHNSVIRYGNSAPIRIFNVTPSFENLSFEHNQRNAVQLIAGSWTSQTLASTDVIYWVHGAYPYEPFNVLENNLLIIQPGVKIKFGTRFDSSGIQVDGSLKADGTKDNPIIFTSDMDDTVCGIGVAGEPICDTNNDGSASAPNAGDWLEIYFKAGSDPTSSISNAVIRYGGGDTGYAPVWINNVTPTLENLSLEQNTENAVLIYPEGWTSNTLDSTTVVYVIPDYRNTLTLLKNNTLNILPGVKIKLGSRSRIDVHGLLKADGTATDPIIFTSIKDDTVCGRGVAGEPICDTNNDGTASAPNAGDWSGIDFREDSDPASSLTRAIIRYGGEGGDFIPGPVRITNVSPELENLSIEESDRNAVQLIGGNWTSQTLDSTSVVYYLGTSWMVVLRNNTLTILPEVKIKIGGFSTIRIEGALRADGTTTEPIIFTSDKDDSVCGLGVFGEPICDTNNDGTASSPQGGQDWESIIFANGSSATSTIRNAAIRYGGSVYSESSAIVIDNSSPTIENVEISEGYIGIEFRSLANPRLACNDVVNNSYGFWNYNPSNQIRAENHWWGSVSGPTNSNNPGGTGDSVNGGIDFTPWANSPCTDFAP